MFIDSESSFQYGEKTAPDGLRCSGSIEDVFDFDGDLESLRGKLDRDCIADNELIDIAADKLALIHDSKRFVIPWLEAAREDPDYLPPVRAYQKGASSTLILFSHEKLQLSLTSLDVNMVDGSHMESAFGDSIIFSGQSTISRFMRSGGCELAIWGCNGSDSHKCQLLNTQKIEDGDVVIQDGESRAYTIGRAKKPIVILQAVVMPNKVSLVREFDKNSCSLMGQSNGSLKSSRIQMYSTLLRLFSRTDSYTLLERYLSHKDTQVRWHVMRELLALDTSASLPALKKMACEDSCELIQAAAVQALKLLENN